MRPSRRKVLREANRYARPVLRETLRAFRTLRSTIPILELEDALSRGDVKRALELIDVRTIDRALLPLGSVIKTVNLRGGKLGPRLVEEDDDAA